MTQRLTDEQLHKLDLDYGLGPDGIDVRVSNTIRDLRDCRQQLREAEEALGEVDAGHRRLTAARDQALERLNAAEDFRYNMAQRAYTAPDADYGTILASLDSRIRDALEQLKVREERTHMSAMLSKTRTVLDLVDTLEGPIFAQRYEGDDRRKHRVGVDYDVWVELGEPAQITVTIEPGDLLKDKRR